METFPSDKLPFLIAVIVAALLLVAWLVYRNFKDEEEYEKEMDEPVAADEHHKHEKNE